MPIEEANTTISFRLPPALHEEVVRLADASGVTKHQLARTLLVRALESDETQDSIAELSGIEDAFHGLQASVLDVRLAIGRGIGAILQEVSPTRSKEEIRRWVFERIITPSKRADSGGEELK